MSKYWQAGDTFWSVVRKRMVENIITAFDPDTYTEKSFKEAKDTLVRYLWIDSGRKLDYWD